MSIYGADQLSVKDLLSVTHCMIVWNRDTKEGAKEGKNEEGIESKEEGKGEKMGRLN